MVISNHPILWFFLLFTHFFVTSFFSMARNSVLSWLECFGKRYMLHGFRMQVFAMKWLRSMDVV